MELLACGISIAFSWFSSCGDGLLELELNAPVLINAPLAEVKEQMANSNAASDLPRSQRFRWLCAR